MIDVTKSWLLTLLHLARFDSANKLYSLLTNIQTYINTYRQKYIHTYIHAD